MVWLIEVLAICVYSVVACKCYPALLRQCEAETRELIWKPAGPVGLEHAPQQQKQERPCTTVLRTDAHKRPLTSKPILWYVGTIQP